MATIKDVALHSQTSVGTVSRYLNGYQVKIENRHKIEKAIEELGFSINLMAKGLKTNITMTVGILIPTLSNIYSTKIIEGIEHYLDDFGYSILVCDSRDDVKIEKQKLKFLQDKHVDGIIIMPVDRYDSGKNIQETIDSGVSAVLIDRLTQGVTCDAVVSDNVNASYVVMQHIIERGHRKIGIIAGDQKIYTAYERLLGYKRALQDYNLPIDDNLIGYSDYTKIGGSKTVNEILEKNTDCTAIFATNYETTISTVKAVLDRGYTIGQEISIFGYDQTELAEITEPPISLVIQPIEDIGKKAAEFLIKRMKRDMANFPSIKRLATKIITTDSIRNIL
ncbi:transcriptional regulator, LacI family [Natronincola peptidivorans]|uniref:Transcriptional regulator, LacI family n=1 Tax=Natronincola peptidivorans TaxID=426128 RepID=A0A1I0E6Z3_9FIRM|nr:LacI family DNA-binding transcriptional regulator [Natronincola peptidivorans]SET40595.1 transcriptional regulator, LacI family [Natronincola peptidivorans]